MRSVGSSIALSSALQAPLGEPVGVLDDQDLPAPADRAQRGAADQVADLVDADRELLGADHRDVGVASRRARCGRRGRCRSRAGPRAHCSAAANATAALERPDPGGPVKSQAWLIPCPAAAACSASTASRWPTRSSQTRHAALTAHRLGRAAGATRVADLRRRSRRRRRGRRARGSGRGRPAAIATNAVADPLVELQRLALDPVAPGEPAQPVRGSRSSTTVRCGRRSWVAQRATCSTSSTTQRPAGALVGQRGVDVAVGDDHVAAVERRQHDGVDVLGLVGGVEQHLGAVGELRRSRG